MKVTLLLLLAVLGLCAVALGQHLTPGGHDGIVPALLALVLVQLGRD